MGIVALVFALFLGGCGTKQEIVVDEPKEHGIQEEPIIVQESQPKQEEKPAPKATMRPYEVNGVVYRPTVVRIGDKFRGVASWYGSDFHGKKTSSGEVYNMYELTAAHKTFPMNTMVKVTNLNNGKSVIVRVNDRGPFVKDRIIDLSYAAAKRLGMLDTGTAPVELEILGFDSTIGTLPKTEGSAAPKEVILKDFAVQIGAFRRYRGAAYVKSQNALVDGRYRAIIRKFDYEGAPIYRVWLVGFRSEQEARDFIASGRYPGAFLIRDVQ
ncbi:MAG: septal ring lytic transglycosylase RlpA family lipoprotein [Nitratiruptor sp.]|nr:septal ring lytic transglycosylase RlpA family lipoprotein [Nitratiruptor sp.]NPA84152.1 septal ring lytic transglycosylase RlpA family protein [Campylobacterota bacterium]